MQNDYRKISRSILMLLAILLCNTLSIHAFNHPEIQWKTVSTKHFYIHYYDKTEPAVYPAWKIAEEAFEVLDSLYEFDDRPGIHLGLADYDDYSNGFALWTQRTIMVWVPADRFDLRSSTAWLRDVITHELAHIMSLDQKRGMQLMDWTVSVEYTSPNVTVQYAEPIAMTSFFPLWFVEGTAQLGAERLGSDCWDSRRDMVLRCAMLDNSLLSLDAMGNFTHDIIGNEKVYNQGYAFSAYLKNNLGEKNFTRIWNENRGRKFFGLTLERYLSKTFNLSLEALYTQWRDSCQAEYKKQIPDTPTEITPVWALGTVNTRPRISPNRKYWGWLTNHKDDFCRTDLVIAHFGEKKPLIRIRYARTDWDFSTDGSTVYFIRARTPNREGSYFNDIFAYNPAEDREERLTRSARIYALAASPNGEDLLCVQYREHIYSIVRYSLKKKQFSTVVQGTAGEPFLDISRLYGDTASCVVSRVVDGKAGVFLLDITDGALKPLTNTEAQEETPFSAPDGRIYFSADYDGIYNVYSLLPDGSDLKRHTSVTGGVFCPVVDTDGTLMVSTYTAQGFMIGTVEPSAVPYEIPNTQVCLFRREPIPKGTVRIKPGPYKSQFLRPSWEILTGASLFDMDRALQDRLTEGEWPDSSWDMYLDISAEIGMVRSDAIDKRDMYLGAAIVVSGNWDETYTTDETGGAFNHASVVPPMLTDVNRSARPHDRKRELQKRYGRVSPALKHDLRFAIRQDTTVDDTADEGTSAVIPYLVPFGGIESRRFAPTIGLDAQIGLISMIPAVFYIDPYINWHVTRDLYIGVSPTFSIMPLYLFLGEEAGFGLSAPFWIEWMYHQYINEDIAYNKAGLTLLRGFIGPDITPFFDVVQTVDSAGTVLESDTVITPVASFIFGIEARHAFPLFHYGSFILSTENYGIKSNQVVYGRVGDIDSTDYRFLFTSATRAALTFPVLRNINSGRLYADNLYGSLFYQLNFAGTDDYFDAAAKDVFVDKSCRSDNASVSHLIGLGFQMGLIKYHTFKRDLNVEAAWDIFDEEIIITMSFRF